MAPAASVGGEFVLQVVSEPCAEKLLATEMVDRSRLLLPILLMVKSWAGLAYPTMVAEKLSGAAVTAI